MTASFTATALAGDRFLVEGTDFRGTTGQTVVDGRQWVELNRRNDQDRALSEFDSAVEEFFAPLTEAIDQLKSVHKVDTDPLLYVVEQEAQAGREEREERLIHLDHGAVILRAIETGHEDRLIWVGENLELTAAPAPAAAEPEPAAGENDPTDGGRIIIE